MLLFYFKDIKMDFSKFKLISSNENKLREFQRFGLTDLKIEKGLDLEISSREDFFRDCCPDYECEMFDSDGLDFSDDWVCKFMPSRKRIESVGIGNDWY